MNILNDISLVDFQNIVRQVRELTGVNLAEFASASLRRRLTRCIQLHNFRFADMLIARIREDPNFADTFFSDLMVESTEFFRDPLMWLLLRETVIPEILSQKGKIRIWMPSCVSGDELYSLIILLHEMEVFADVRIQATCPSKKNLKHILSGITQHDKIHSSTENYLLAGGKNQLTDYFTSKGILYYKTLLMNNFIDFDVSFLPSETKHSASFDLILFRNQMLYYGRHLQNQTLSFFHQNLHQRGILVIGNKEQIDLSYFSDKFLKVDAEEKIYRKK